MKTLGIAVLMLATAGTAIARMLRAAEQSPDATREAVERRNQDARFQLAMQIAINAGRERAPIGIVTRPCTQRPIFFCSRNEMGA